jgi:RNA polymerase sigma factor (sigma-70 family)
MRASALPVPTEETIAGAIARGDYRGALTMLMEEMGDDIHRHVSQVVGDPALADDVHQTVFVQAYRDMPSFGGRASVRTWLYAIARNRCLDALKARQRWWRRVSAPEIPPELWERADAAELADSALDGRRRAQALVRAVGKLSPKSRIAVLLRYQEGLSYEEMSQVCGASPAALQARVSRAVEKIRAMLEANDAL